MTNLSQNFEELNSPLEMYPRPKKDSFFKETQDFISNNETGTQLNTVEI